ncbi:hypothetical protein D9M73_219870 [compost metagenome]
MQQGELLGGQVDPLCSAIGAVTGGIEFQVGDAQGFRRGNLFAAPQQCAHPCQQFRELEWLHQIIVRAEVQPLDLVGQPAACGEHHDPGISGLAQALQDAPAVELRHVHIEDQQVVGMLSGKVQSIHSGMGHIDDIATFGKSLVEIFGSLRVVLDYQDSHGVKSLGR